MIRGFEQCTASRVGCNFLISGQIHGNVWQEATLGIEHRERGLFSRDKSGRENNQSRGGRSAWFWRFLSETGHGAHGRQKREG